MVLITHAPLQGLPPEKTEEAPPLPPWDQLPDIGGMARWSVSSAKFGFGLECLRDENPETFWHSEGNQPHSITLEFPKRVAIQKIAVYLSHKKDDSYTPERMGIRAGTSLRDLQDVRTVRFEKPEGWIEFAVSSEDNNQQDELDLNGGGTKPLYAYVLQLVIIANFMSGKDTHIRGLKICGPEQPLNMNEEEPLPWKTDAYTMHLTYR